MSAGPARRVAGGALAAVCAALVFAPRAPAAPLTKVVVGEPPGENRGVSGIALVPGLELNFQPSTDPFPSRFVVEVPTGYQLDLGAKPGETVAIASISLVGVDDGSFANGFGDLKAADPAGYATDPCAPGLHAAVWTVPFSLAGQPSRLTIFVDPGGPAGVAYTLQACPSALPPGTSRTILSIDLEDLAGLKLPAAPGRYVWRMTATPPAGAAYEAQAVLPLPDSVSVKGRYERRKRAAVLTGKVVVGGRPAANAHVVLQSLSRPDAPTLDTRTHPDGSFTFRAPMAATDDFAVSVDLIEGPCELAPAAPGGCVSSLTVPPDSATETVWVSVRGGAVRTPRAADQRLAEREEPGPSDFARGSVAAGSAGHTCTNLTGESDLTITGESSSPVFLDLVPASPPRSFEASGLARVYRTATQARAAFEREAVAATA